MKIHCWLRLRPHRWTFFAYVRWPWKWRDTCQRCGHQRERWDDGSIERSPAHLYLAFDHRFPNRDPKLEALNEFELER